ncbi:protein phosphatase 2C domain-containing protein [Streptomyces botrytidirepellens]|uniref:Mucin-2 n=1 Tax=Streptomyces botrytidirepellens TaxID=2486417 RepID=A0A3M8WN33_9ACTN|nr:protein phosphatase 2C domain-containing protein [Streptomyces botrytidirepellens]RNG30369.1 mucin-2 [Streptomyces botrytidirepellens]
MYLVAHATAQQQGGRSHQCDAHEITAAPNGTTAFAVLDGIGSAPAIRAWTRRAAGRLAHAALYDRSAEHGLRRVYDQYADAGPEFTDTGDELGAAALVALLVPGQPLELAWCGDVRAYAIRDNQAERLTHDHNKRRVQLDRGKTPREYDRNLLTSYLGSDETDDEVRRERGHPAIETTTVEPGKLRLVLATDGAYEPLADLGHHLLAYLDGYPAQGRGGLHQERRPLLVCRQTAAARRQRHRPGRRPRPLTRGSTHSVGQLKYGDRCE